VNIYLLERNGFIRYDECDAFVVQANGPKQARTLASERAGDEGRVVWINPSYSTCKVLGWATRATAEAAVILRSFNAG
jgi:hypothetical protein